MVVDCITPFGKGFGSFREQGGDGGWGIPFACVARHVCGIARLRLKGKSIRVWKDGPKQLEMFVAYEDSGVRMLTDSISGSGAVV